MIYDMLSGSIGYIGIMLWSRSRLRRFVLRNSEWGLETREYFTSGGKCMLMVNDAYETFVPNGGVLCPAPQRELLSDTHCKNMIFRYTYSVCQ